MKFNMSTASPWADFHRIVSNTRKLRIVAAGVTYEGDADVSIDDAGCVTIDVGGHVAKAAKAKAA